MDYFAGLDISMDETHVCVLDREGVVVRESKTESTAEAIAGELAKAPSCQRIVFETGRMAPILFHGLSQLGLPVVCVESRQAYQALKSLATHKTDRNDARGLAHLARTGFFKPVHVKSLQAHALRSLIIARKKLVGQRVTLENQIRGLAVVFGIRLPRALTAAFVNQALQASEGIAGLSAAHAGIDCGTNRGDDCGRCDRRRHETYDKSLGGLPSADDHPRRRPTDRARLCGRNRRSFAHPPIPRRRRLSGTGSKAASVWRDRLRLPHLEVRRHTRANPPIRGGQCDADPLQGPAQTQGLGLRDRQAINDAQSASRSGSPPRDYHACDAARRDRVRICLSPRHETGGRIQLPRGATPEGGSRRRRGFCSTRPTYDRLRFQPSRAAPSLPHQVPNEHVENAGTRKRRHPKSLPPLTH
jgi:transposase